MDEQESMIELIIFMEEQEEERHPIRKIWHNGRLYFSIVDIITALNVAQSPRRYWVQLKDRVEDEGFEQAINQVLQFRLKASDGKFRLTDCADQETMLRLIQSIPSKRVEQIKQFLARAGSEKLDEIAMHRLVEQAEAPFRAKVQEYIDRGYEPEWAGIRTQDDLVRNDLTDTWTDRGAQGSEFGMLTATMHKGAFGILPGAHKQYKKIPAKEELCDHMTIPELGVSIFTESIGITLRRKRDSQGFQELQRDAHDAGEAGRQARETAEATLGEPVVSSENYMHLKKIKGSKPKKALPGSPGTGPQPTQRSLFEEG